MVLHSEHLFAFDADTAGLNYAGFHFLIAKLIGCQVEAFQTRDALLFLVDQSAVQDGCGDF